MARTDFPDAVFKFTVSGVTISPTTGATYTNNSSTFTVQEVSINAGSGTIHTERTTGTNPPLASGTLTKASGTGDATISYSAATAAGLVTVLAATNGGELYWFFRVTPSGTPGPTNKFIVAGNIRTTSFTDTDVLADRLLDISDLDIRGNPFESPLAKVADVKIKIQNITAGIDFDDFLGRIVEVFVGSGTTMSTATAAVMFTGKIKEVITIKDRVIFVARGRGELRDKEIGEKLGPQVDKRYVGAIKPIGHGDWTDDQAFFPSIYDRKINDYPKLVFDNRDWKGPIDGIFAYDDQLRIGIRAMFDENFTIETGKFQAALVSQITTLSIGMNGIDKYSRVNLTNNDLLTLNESNSSSPTSPTIILIEDELMLVIEHPDNGAPPAFLDPIRVERGWGGTTISSHTFGTNVFQIGPDVSKLLIRLQHIFFPIAIGTPIKSGTGLHDVRPQINITTFHLSLINEDNTDFVEYQAEQLTKKDDAGSSLLIDIPLVFPKTGLTGAIKDLFVIAKVDSLIDLTDTDNSLPYDLSVALSKDNAIGVPLNVTGAMILRISRTTVGTTNTVFDNILGSNTEREKIVTKGLIRVFTFTGTLTDQPNSDSVYKDNNNTEFRTATVTTSPKEIFGVYVEGAAAPAASGTLTRVLGKGDDSISYSSFVFHYDSSTSEGISIENIEDMANTRIKLAMDFGKGTLQKGTHRARISRVGLRADFTLALDEHDVWVKAKTREIPASPAYFNGSARTLIEAPSIIIEDFCRNDVADMTAANDLEESFFDTFHTDRTAWKLSTVIYTR